MDKEKLAIKLIELGDLAASKNPLYVKQYKSFANKVFISSIVDFREYSEQEWNEICRGYSKLQKQHLKVIINSLLGGEGCESIVESKVPPYSAYDPYPERIMRSRLSWEDGDNKEELKIIEDPRFGYWKDREDDIALFESGLDF